MHRLTTYFVVIAFIAMSTAAFAQAVRSGYSESYLQRDIGSRAIAMGGAYTATVGDPFAFFYNPAGLGFQDEKIKIASTYSFLEFGRVHSTLAFTHSPVENFGYGIGFNSYRSGSFIARDIRGNPLGEMSNWHYCLVGAASYRIEFASIGVAFKYLNNNLAGSDAKADGYSFDIGAEFNVANLFAFGISMQNISGMMFWKGGSDERELLPYTLRAGIAMEIALDSYSPTNIDDGFSTFYDEGAIQRYVTVYFDAVLNQHEEVPAFLLGAEIIPDDVIAFRAGLALAADDQGTYKFLPMTRWGSGISINPTFLELPFNIRLDYAVASDYISINRIAHHLTLSTEF
jgi:hypothetical protein